MLLAPSKCLSARRSAIGDQKNVARGFVPTAPGGEWTMANIARPPCDEAAILAGSCEHPPAITNSPWILAATILGSSMAFIDGTVVNVALLMPPGLFG